MQQLSLDNKPDTLPQIESRLTGSFFIEFYGVIPLTERKILCQPVKIAAAKKVTRNGFIRSKQRYRCKTCGYNFIVGDERTNPQTVVKRAFAVILYVLGRASYRSIAQLFDVSISTVSNWLTSETVLSNTSQILPNCSELEFDEMQNFISSRRTSSELTKQFLVQPVESLSGLSVIVMLIPPTD